VPGGKPIIFFPMLALLEPGDEVIYPNPGFPIYESMIRFLGAKPIPMRLEESRSFSFDLNLFRELLTDRTKMVILNSPQNPTGGVIPRGDVDALASLLRDRDLIVLSDEIYSRIHYGDEPPVSMMPEWLVTAVNKLMVNSNSCTASFTQRAGIAALTGPQDDVDRMVSEFRRRRDAICKGLNEIPGFRCAVPGGAFYAFANVTETGIPSDEMEDVLLNEAGVACLNGGAFGEYGKGYIRFSYANSFENLMEAVDRIRKVAVRWEPVAAVQR
jgi:aspartate/methionine/tyrosine aminotransferase